MVMRKRKTMAKISTMKRTILKRKKTPTKKTSAKMLIPMIVIINLEMKVLVKDLREAKEVVVQETMSGCNSKRIHTKKRTPSLLT